MKTLSKLALSLILIAPSAIARPSLGQDLPTVLTATERLEKFRGQLRDVKARSAELRERIRVLEIELQPENLQRAINQIGTLSADELRDARRRQLESEKTKAQEQLASLEESRISLEKTIGEAEIEIARLKAAAATARENASVTKPDGTTPQSDVSASAQTVAPGNNKPTTVKRKSARRTSRR